MGSLRVVYVEVEGEPRHVELEGAHFEGLSKIPKECLGFRWRPLVIP